MLRLQSAFSRMKHSILNEAEPLHLRRQGLVTGVTKNSAGVVTACEVTMDGIPYTGVAPSQEAGLAVGATVDVEGIGKAGSAISWKVERVRQGAVGGGSTDPHGEISTPSIYDVESRAAIMPDGTVITTLDVIVQAIAEQYRQRQRVFYEVWIRDADTGATLGNGTSIVLERVEGSLDADILSGATSATVNQVTGGAEFRFPFNKGVVEIGTELAQYQSVLGVSPTQATLTSLTRGYNGTTPAGHTEGDRVTLRGIPITKEVATVGEYEIKVRAINATDGRVSNWSDAVNYEHDGDTTAPTWSGSDNLTAAAADGGVVVTWDAADTDADDLDYYEVRHSNDNSAWVVANVGNVTTWAYNGRVGDIRFFQVRAVDRSGNSSAWSGSVRGGVFPPHEPTTANLITNGSLDSNTNNYTLSSTSGAATKNHDTSVYHTGGGAMRIDESRDGSLQRTWEIISNSFTVAAATDIHARLMVRQSGYSNVVDVTTITLRNASTNVEYAKVVIPGTKITANTGEWLAVELDGYVPDGVTSLELFTGGTLETGAGATSFWIDEIVVTQPVQSRVNSMGRLQVGGGSEVARVLTNTASLNFGSIASGNEAELTITVPGAASGDDVRVTPASGIEGGLSWNGWVSAADTVTVRLSYKNIGGGASIDPAARTWRATVTQF